MTQPDTFKPAEGVRESERRVRRCPGWPTSAIMLLASLAMGASFTSCGGQQQPQINDLQFQQSGKILEAKTVAAGQSYGWGTGDLGTVPDIPLAVKAAPGGGNFNPLNLWYQTPVISTEVDLFALDPTTLAEKMTSQLPFIELATGNDQFWTLLVTTQPNNPPAAAIPYPAPPGLAPYPPVTVPLSTSLFLPANAVPLEGDAALPTGTGSIKAARIYDHGSCSTFQPAVQVYQQIFSQFDSNFACGFADQGATPQRTYSHLATRLKNTPNDPTNLADGFVFDGYYGAGVPVFPNITVFFNQSYSFYASNGLAQVQPGTPFVSANGHDSDQVYGTIKGVLINNASDTSLPLQLDSSFEKQQTIAIPGAPACTKTNGLTSYPISTALHHAYQSECQGAIQTLGLAIAAGAPKLQLSQQEAQTLQKSLSATWPYDDGHGPYWSDWRCVPAPQPGVGPPNQCQFTIPVKRLNVYPDGVELVWFDGKELNNAAFALYVAAFGAPNQKPGLPPPGAQQLCSFHQVQPNVGLSYNRWFATLSEGKVSGLGGFGVVCP